MRVETDTGYSVFWLTRRLESCRHIFASFDGAIDDYVRKRLSGGREVTKGSLLNSGRWYYISFLPRAFTRDMEHMLPTVIAPNTIDDEISILISQILRQNNVGVTDLDAEQLRDANGQFLDK